VFVGTGQVERKKPARVANARKVLRKTINGSKLRSTLKLPEEPAKSTKEQPAVAAA
jgi:hypothetical protein